MVMQMRRIRISGCQTVAACSVMWYGLLLSARSSGVTPSWSKGASAYTYISTARSICMLIWTSGHFIRFSSGVQAGVTAYGCVTRSFRIG